MNQRRKSLEHMTFHLDIPRDLKEKRQTARRPHPIYSRYLSRKPPKVESYSNISRDLVPDLLTTPCTTFYFSIAYAPFTMDTYG